MSAHTKRDAAYILKYVKHTVRHYAYEASVIGEWVKDPELHKKLGAIVTACDDVITHIESRIKG